MTLPLAALLQGAVSGETGGGTAYVDDVFSTYLYTGNGSTQTITNGIDLSTYGGMVWTKKRSGAYSHYIYDTIRGVNASLNTNDTSENDAGANELTAFNSTGFALGTSANINGNAATYASWTFRKAPKFFDVVTYTGTGSSQTISHSLNQTVGVLVIKRISGTGNWATFARTGGAAGATQYAYFNTSAGLNLTAAAGATGIGAEAAGFITSTGFKPNDLSGSGGAGNADNINENGATYVAYLFAHDTAADGIIQCGSFTTDGSGNATVNLGWEPQWLLAKGTSAGASWSIADQARGFTATTNGNVLLYPNTASADDPGNYIPGQPTATGFNAKGSSTSTYIYLAIRRPNKPPTLGTQVYNVLSTNKAQVTQNVNGLGFAPDFALMHPGTGNAGGHFMFDRLRGNDMPLYTNATTAESGLAGTLCWFSTTMDGIRWGDYGAYYYGTDHFFRRAPGVFDEVCYTGTGVAKTEAHNLGVAPELWIIKGRSGATAWRVGCTALANTDYLVLDSTAASATDATSWDSTYPTVSVFSLGTQSAVNTSSATYAAYLFATKAGISKVFSFTGNGTNQNIECGFTTGARFVLLKRTDSAGNWLVADTARGIVAGNDPSLALNSTAAEVTTVDWIDPYSGGFNVVQESTNNVNVNNATYIGIAFA